MTQERGECNMEENTIVIKNGNVEKEFTKLLEFKSDKDTV